LVELGPGKIRIEGCARHLRRRRAIARRLAASLRGAKAQPRPPAAVDPPKCAWCS
jgi:hypothetical protein